MSCIFWGLLPNLGKFLSNFLNIWALLVSGNFKFLCTWTDNSSLMTLTNQFITDVFVLSPQKTFLPRATRDNRTLQGSLSGHRNISHWTWIEDTPNSISICIDPKNVCQDPQYKSKCDGEEVEMKEMAVLMLKLRYPIFLNLQYIMEALLGPLPEP